MTNVTMSIDGKTNELILEIQHRMAPNTLGRQDLATQIINKIVDAVVDDFLTNNTLEIIKQLDTQVIAQMAQTKAILKLMEKLDHGTV